VNTIGTDNGTFGTDWGLALSLVGRRIALSVLTELGSDIWIKQLPTRSASRLTPYVGVDPLTAWTPDGHAVTFLSDRSASTESNGKGNAFTARTSKTPTRCSAGRFPT
jgi:Tol biopolymer transport system component